MKASMYAFSVPVFVKTLGNLSAILAKGAAYAEQKKFDPAVLLAMRLAPDMYPLAMQVRIACDFAKGSTARLAGEEPPKWEDSETTIAELQARIPRTFNFVQGFDEARFDGADARRVTLTIRGEQVEFDGLAYRRTWRCRTSSSTPPPPTTSCATPAWNSASATSSARSDRLRPARAALKRN